MMKGLQRTTRSFEGNRPILVAAPRRKTLAAILLVAVIGLAYAGQRVFSQRQGGPFPLMGLAMVLVAMALLAYLTLRTGLRFRRTAPGRSFVALSTPLTAEPWRILCAAIAIGASLAATIWGQMPDRSWLALAAWLLSMICMLLAAATRPSLTAWRVWIVQHRREVALIAACMLVALAARIVNLATVPPIISGDEGSMGLEAREILSGHNTQLFVTGWSGIARMTFLTMAIPMWVWGQDIFGLRMHAVLVGTATIPTLYWLLRREGGVWLAQCSIWLLAAYPYHIHVSRLGINNADDSLLLTTTFAALFWGARSHKPIAWVIVGLCGGLSLYLYAGARIVIVLGVGLVSVLGIQTRGRWLMRHWPGLLIAAAVFVVTALPITRFYLAHWADFNTRMNQVGIVQSGWLQREAQASGRSTVAILFDQLVHGVFAYNLYLDQQGWYNDTEALLQFWPGMLFPLGLAVAFLNARRPLYLLLILWFFSIVILGAALTIDPPAYTRLTGLSPALITLVALALTTLARVGTRLALWRNGTAVAATALVVLAFGISGARHYFVDYAPRYRYDSLNGELATEAGKQLSVLDGSYRAYFLGMPRMFYDFSTIAFLAPQITGSDVSEDIVGLPPDFEPDRPAYFFSIPERESDLRLIQQIIPGGEWIEVKRVVDRTPLFYAYRVGAIGS